MSGFFHRSLLRVEPACGSRTWTNTGSQYAGAVSKFIYFRDSNDAVFYEDKKSFGMVLIYLYCIWRFACTGRCWNFIRWFLGLFLALIAELLLRLGKLPETESGDSCFCDCQHWCKWECPLYGVGKYRIS